MPKAMNSTGAGRTVLDGFAEWVEKTPDQPAVVSDGRSLTYRELDLESTRLAHDLRERGAGPETVVGLSVRRGIELAVAVLGVVKAGGAYLPLDPDHPADRVRLMLTDAAASLVVSERAVSGAMGADGWGLPVVHLDADRSDFPATPLDPAGQPDALLYVIYTSGSTGRPKGIAMQAGPQITLLDWCRDQYASQPNALQYFPITADVAFLELMSTWWLGGRAVIATELERYDVAALADLIERHEVDKLLLPVVALDELAKQVADRPEKVARLREVITTGDRLVVTPEIRAMCARLPEVVLDNHYGSTEVNVVTAPRLAAPVEDWPEQPHIGKPMADSRIYVLDAGLRPVPRNVPGDIYIGGGPLSRGYLARPGLTAAAFVPDPFSPVPGARMYRIGDVGRWRAGGVLEYMGRRDFQIKLHGYRIEPGEIESVLRERDDIDNAVVVVSGGGQEAMLVAYVVPTGTAPSSATLRQHLAEVLPSYMVPQAVVQLAEFPLTDTGKINRAALPAPDAAEPMFVAPRDELERTVAGIFATVLGVDKVGIDDSFFRLGGHSLLVTQLVHRLRAACGANLSLRAVFERPTVAGLAGELRRDADVAGR
ncbi:amino acid adenylation domain-containing protein [Amycolatopsis sp. NPDC058340]|uniref:non-ribosomal peptide synthetase n=1 Tax=Amycolatopsis sp. NPDC058340 TaxID=3346453 RepID=UPI00364F2195